MQVRHARTCTVDLAGLTVTVLVGDGSSMTAAGTGSCTRKNMHNVIIQVEVEYCEVPLAKVISLRHHSMSVDWGRMYTLVHEQDCLSRRSED